MWSYLHYTYSAAPAADCSQTRCLDLDRSEPSSAMTTAGAFCSTDKLTAAYMDSLFGMTSARSGRTTRQPETISTDSEQSVTDSVSAADSHVKILARRGIKQGLQANTLDYGKSMPVLLARLDRSTCTWKTPPTLLGEGLTLSAQTYPAWGIVLHGALYPLRPLERDTSDADFGGLQCETIPTPTMHNRKADCNACNTQSKLIRPAQILQLIPDSLRKWAEDRLAGSVQSQELKTLDRRRKDRVTQGLRRETQPRLGRVANGLANWLDEVTAGQFWDAEEHGLSRLSEQCDNRRQRLRAIGNGQVPLCAAVAFVTLLKQYITFCDNGQ